VFPELGTVALVTVFGKYEKDDLTAGDRKAIMETLRSYAGELEREWRGGRKGEPS
jgi:hypothetical protein